MKFARYLEDNCTPEWKRAYIDYRRLKKCIKAIQQRQQNPADPSDPADVPPTTDDDEDDGNINDDENDSSDREDHGPVAGLKAPKSKDMIDGKNKRRWWDRIDHPRMPPSEEGTQARTTEQSHGDLGLGNMNDSRLQPRRQSDGKYGSLGNSPALRSISEDRQASGGNSSRSPAAPPELRLPDSTLEAQGVVSSEDETQRHTPTSISSRTGLAGRAQEIGSSPRPHNAEANASSGGRSREGSSSGKRRETTRDSSSGDEDGNVVQRTPQLAGKSPRIVANGIGGIKRTDTAGTVLQSSSFGAGLHRRQGNSAIQARFPESIEELYKGCSTEEAKFFQTLDGELEKVESFYHDRESDALKRSRELTNQLNELAEHRRVFHEFEEERMNESKVQKYLAGPLEGVQKRIPFVANVIQAGEHKLNQAQAGLGIGLAPGEKGKEKQLQDGLSEGRSSSMDRRVRHEDGFAPANANGRPEFDPEKYQRYKKKLRLAIIEFYKELEILKNYRILNLTGFKKALKKFEKTAKVKCIDLYMEGKVAKRSFADGKTVDRLLKDMEDEFTSRFEKGDHKRAVGRLRGQFVTKTHHLSTFSSGTYIGIGLPVMILGLVEGLKASTRRDFPQVEPLMQVYSALFLPVLFGMLFELNLSAYVAARINYGFIMELDIRTAIDHRQFLEIPALLYAVLCYCFYFSMHRVGAPAISPYAWPIVWIVFLVAFFLNPIPVNFQHARYWLLSVLGRVLTPGYSRVEFIAFFVADELNSLTYSIGNLWFIGCAYNHHWPANTTSVCHSAGNWVYGFLVCIPASIRLIQCLKRYKDSRLKIHLVNAGKYCSSILQLALFSYWRSRGSHIKDHSFAIWATGATIASTYTSAWDLSIDWGLLRPHAGYLRESLGYPSIKPYYYVAMVLNVIVRFVWVWYIPNSTSDVRLKSFIFALAEMLRRWQWNFFRVETEQVGNTDQYRVTREVPLPYRVIPEDEDDEEVLTRKRTRRQKGGYGLRSAALRLGDLRERILSGHFRAQMQPDRNANAGPRGDDSHREYEPRAPDDRDIVQDIDRAPSGDSQYKPGRSSDSGSGSRESDERAR